MGRMPAPERSSRGGISITTLVIASAASACAAFVVSRVWGTGTLIGAAVTPIIVAIVTELLRRPAGRLPDIVPGPARDQAAPPPPAADEPPAPAEQHAPPVHVYRAGPPRQWKLVAITAAAAFAIGVGLYVGIDRLAGGQGRLVTERDTPAETVTNESQTTTVVTQQSVTVQTVVVPAETTPPATTTEDEPAPATDTTTDAAPGGGTQTAEPAPPEG